MATIITTVQELQDISLDLTDDYELGNDIEAVGYGFTMLGVLTGSLDGLGFEIRDLTITVSGAATRRGALIFTNQGTVKNVHLRDCVIDITSTTHNAIATSLIWYNDVAGVIEDCSAIGTVTAVGVTAATASGLVHSNDGSIDDSWSSVITSATAAGANATANGFLDENIGPINNCYAQGAATAVGATAYANGFIEQNYPGGVISYSYSTGKPTAGSAVSGFCRVNDDTITACFWDLTTSGTAVSDGGTGKTTAEMKLIATFSAWDIALSVPDPNNGYPYLGWQIDESDTWLIYGLSPRPTTAIQEKITLETIRNLEMSARGRFRVSKDGNAVYRSRYARNA